MTLTVAGRPLRSPRMLSEIGQLVLACIDGGTQWLQSASKATAQRYDFADERSLLDDVQQGLHGTSMLWLPRIGLQVGPAKLLTLAVHELALIQRAENGDDSAALARQVQDVLARHDLATNAELASADAFLAELGVATAPLLQALDFDARVAVWRLAAASQPASRAVSRREAADFALAQARSPLEFCDYYRYYLQSAADGRSATARRQATTEALHALLPALFDALGGARFDGFPAPDEMQFALNRSLTTGRTVGFPRLSLAAQQIAGHVPHLGSDPDRLRRSVASVLEAAQALLSKHLLRPGRVGQDGASLQFLVRDGDHRVLLQFANNVLTIADLAVAADAVAAETPPPATPRRPQAIPAPAAPPVRDANATTEQILEQAQQQVAAAMRTAERLIAEAEAIAAAAVRQATEAADAAQAAANAATDGSSRT